MNLDNSVTTFDGPPFPLRLRHVLEDAASLSEARSIWEATNNTDSMNFLIASARERSALAIEAIGGRFAASAPHQAFSAFFADNSTIERRATCTVGTKEGGTCGTGFVTTPATSAGLKPIGAPLAEAVWRTNRATRLIIHHQSPRINHELTTN